MSRHARYRHAEVRRARPTGPADGVRPVGTASTDAAPISPPTSAKSPLPGPEPELSGAADPQAAPEVSLPAVFDVELPVATAPMAAGAPMPMAAMHAPTAAAPVRSDDSTGLVSGCTPAQLRRFIKSRAYLPVHEIRRRFGIESADDDVTGFDLESGRIYVGLPAREGRILGDLVRAGEVGYELQLDPESPIVVGVYPMRPVTRQ